MFAQWRRRREVAKIKAGDGGALPPYRFWQPLSRSLFYLRMRDDDRTVEYAVNVDFFHLWSVDYRAELYRDGIQIATSTLPATLPVPGGHVSVAAGTLGLTRMHYVTDDGDERPLTPHPRSAEGLRSRFGRRFPVADRFVGAVAVVVLVAGLVVLAPQLLDWITDITWVSEHIGDFTTPISLPPWADTALVVGGIVAGLERALTLRNHWLIDAETFWLG